MRSTWNFVRLVAVAITLAAATGAQTHRSMAQEVFQRIVTHAMRSGTEHSFDLFVPEPGEGCAAYASVGGCAWRRWRWSGTDQSLAARGQGEQDHRAGAEYRQLSASLGLALRSSRVDPDAIDTLSQTYPVDKHRLYLWGYSAGGMFAFYFAFLESRYFAAAAVHGGVIENFKYQMADFAVRKIPLAYYLGTRDQWWTTKQSRASRDALLSRNFEVHYVELAGADHNFFARSAEITADAWEFFKRHPLDNEPRFDPLDLKKIKKALR